MRTFGIITLGWILGVASVQVLMQVNPVYRDYMITITS